MKHLYLLVLAALSLWAFEPSNAFQDYLQTLKQEAQKSDPAFEDFNADRGKKIFFAQQTQEGEKISCASCHGKDLTKSGENSKTGKTIKPLAPSANPERLTDIRDVRKWLMRNFNDVYGRRGTAREKGDALYYIMNQ